MKKVLAFILAAPILFITVLAIADGTSDLMGLGLPGAIADKITQWITIDSTGNLVLKIPSGKVAQVQVAGTPSVQIDSATGIAMQVSTQGVRLSPYVATPATALTPGASNVLRPYSVVATAAPTAQAVKLPDSPTDGDIISIYNPSANPLIVAAMSTPAFNQSTNRVTTVAAKAGLDCTYVAAAGSWKCRAPVYPTAPGG
jgi:hypothetical protein